MEKTDNTGFDAIIIGSGPGGATTARELSKRGEKVLILERGKDPKVKGSLFQTVPTFRQHKTIDNVTVMTQSIAGGATFSFCGVALDPPYEKFSTYGIDLREDVDDIKKELGIATLPDGLIGPMSRRIMNSAQELGIPWKKLPKFIDASICRPGCWRCMYNCPYGAKWTARRFAVEVMDNGGVFKTNTNVNTILIENGKSTGVVYEENGKKTRAEASCVVVSAGGLDSPKLLKKVGVDGVGQNFFVDPLLMVMGIVPGVQGGLKEIPMSTGVNFSDEGYLLTDFTFTGLRYIGNALAAGKILKMFSGRSALSIMIKIRDELSGTLSDKGPINKTLGEDEKKRFKGGIELAEQILKKAGAQTIFKTSMVASHPGGTVKIGDVVDQNLKTPIENLYVCDASVIPTAWGQPPVLTLIALGKRLARHLAA